MCTLLKWLLLYLFSESACVHHNHCLKDYYKIWVVWWKVYLICSMWYFLFPHVLLRIESLKDTISLDFCYLACPGGGVSNPCVHMMAFQESTVIVLKSTLPVPIIGSVLLRIQCDYQRMPPTGWKAWLGTPYGKLL